MVFTPANNAVLSIKHQFNSMHLCLFTSVVLRVLCKSNTKACLFSLKILHLADYVRVAVPHFDYYYYLLFSHNKSHLPLKSQYNAGICMPVPWWRHQMKTFSALPAFCRGILRSRWSPHSKASDAELWCFFDLRLNKRLSKQTWDWWFETPSWSLWRHCNAPARFGPRFVYHTDNGRFQTPWYIPFFTS